MVIPDLPELVISLKKCNKGFLEVKTKIVKMESKVLRSVAYRRSRVNLAEGALAGPPVVC